MAYHTLFHLYLSTKNRIFCYFIFRVGQFYILLEWFVLLSISQVDDGVIEVESSNNLKYKVQLIKQIKSDLVKHQVVNMGGKLPTPENKSQLVVK